MILKLSIGIISPKWQIVRKSSYRVLVIPGHTKVEQIKKETRRIKNQQVEPRYKRMGGDGSRKGNDEWVDVWPTAKSFNYSVLPLPVRMGYTEGSENDGVTPGKYANAELMKIPNFLHLTPAHIHKHCQQLKKLCTAWPDSLKQDKFMQTTHFDYVRDSACLKDERARFVSLTVKLSSLNLPKIAKEKFLRLTSRFCVRQNDLLILTSGKCASKQQNFDYLNFLLSVLYKESFKREEWEDDMELEDMSSYEWKLNKSHKNVMQLLSMVEKDGVVVKDVVVVGDDVVGDDGVVKDDVVAKDDVVVEAVDEGKKNVVVGKKTGRVREETIKINKKKKIKSKGGLREDTVVERYGRSVENLLREEENLVLVQQYKDSVRSLYTSILNK